MFEVGETKIGMSGMTVGVEDGFQAETLSLPLRIELCPPKDAEILTANTCDCDPLCK